MQLTYKLQHITMMLQPHPAPQPNEEPVHKTAGNTDTLCATQRVTNLTTALLQDIATFNPQDSSKLEDWFMDIKAATDILTESHTCLAEVKPHCLTHTLIHEALQARNCWDEIKGIFRLKLCNANIHTYTSCFMEIQQKGSETITAYVHCFKTAPKQCALTVTLQPSTFLLKDFGCIHHHS